MKKLKLNIQMFASTNKTANYDLPQFVGTDKPTWLGDINEAMADIDAGMHANATNISNMASDVASASATASQASQDVAGLTSTVNSLSSDVTAVTTTANNAQQTATSALNTANTANGKADTNASGITTINTNIGDLSNLDTTDKTNIVSAINEVNEEAIGSNGVTVWKNPNMASTFNAQTVNLLESINNYDAFEVIYRQSTSNANCLTSGILPATLGAFMQVGGSQNHWRECTINGNQATFNNAANSTGSTDDNGFVIPEYIIFYNVTRFNQL